MDEFIDNIIKTLPKEQAEFLKAHRAEFVDYIWDHENWPLEGFFAKMQKKMEPPAGFEPATSSLPWMRSTN